jgi:outer membrane protein OmpA-like peptidoglycan-associated protein
MVKVPLSKLLSVRFLRKFGLWSVIGFSFFTLFGFFGFPFILKAVVTNQLPKVLHRAATIQEVHFNPFYWTLQIKGFSLKDQEGTAPFLTFDELALDLESASLWHRGPIVRDVVLKAPRLSIVRNEDQTYNFSDLLPEFSAIPEPGPELPPAEPLRFSVNNIRLEGGSIDFDDRPKQTQHTVRDLNIGIPFLSNLSYDIDVYTQPAFALKANGTPISLTGKSKPFSNSRETSLDIDMNNIELPKYVEYVPADLRFKLTSGSLQTKLALSFVQQKEQAAALTVQGTVALDQFVMTDLTDQPLLTLPHLEVPIDAVDVFARKAHLGAILLQSPEVHAKLDKAGVLNLTTLVGNENSSPPSTTEPSATQPVESEKPEPPPPQVAQPENAPQGTERGEAPSPVVEVEEVRVTDGKLYFNDETTEKPFQTTLDSVNVSIKQFSTDQTKPFTVEAAIKSEVGEAIKQTGTVILSPLKVEGEVELQGVLVNRYAPYYARFLLFDIEEGLVDLATKYAYAKEENSATLSGLTITLKSLRLKKPGEKDDFLKLPTFSVNQVDLDLAKQTITIEEVTTSKGWASVRREKDGTINVATLTPARSIANTLEKKAFPAPLQKETAPQTVVQEPSAPPWVVIVKKITLDQYAVRFDDLTPPQPVTLIAEPVSVTAENFSTEKNSQLKTAIRLTLNKTGTLAVDGPLGLDPLSATLKVTGKNLNILPLRPYFADKLKIVVKSGAASADGTLALQAEKDGNLKVTYTGQAAVTKLATIEKTTTEDFLQWKSLALTGINVDTSPFRLTIGEVALVDFYSRLILNPDATLNVQGVVVSEQTTPSSLTQAPTKAQLGPAPTTPTPAPTTAASQPIKIAKVTLQGGTVDFSDRSIQPNYSARLKQLGGRISGLTSEEDKPADVDLRSTLDDGAPLEITGKVNPFSRDLYVDLAVNMRGVDLNQMTTYSGKYVGYTIQKGKLSLGLKYLIANRRLQSENKITIDQLTFGDTVNSPHATSLPVRLAVSLLKDRNGVIMLDLPVSGSLDDPQFSVWGTIVQVLTNLIAKAATAPFALIGAALGGGGEEMSSVEFEYGRATLDASAEEKLKKISTALADRPSLALDISGYAEKDKDLEGLRQYRFERKLKVQKMGEEEKEETEETALDQVTIAQDEYLKYLTLSYKNESFPKPRNLIGLAKSLPQEEMETLMLTHIEVTDADLHELAKQRAQVVKEYLLKSGNIEASRIFLVEPTSIFSDGAETRKGSRVDFAIK